MRIRPIRERGSLRGKVVVITGASSGIGREAALLFAEAGAKVVIGARRAERLAEVRRQIVESGGACLAMTVDVADRGDVQKLLDGAVEGFGRVDIWINNAGSGLIASVEETTVEEIERLWAVNTMGVFHGCQAALRQMRRQGGGHIMNVSSMVAKFPVPLSAAYTATKSAMNGLSEALHLELAGSGIHVTTLLVSLTDTEFGAAQIKKLDETSFFQGPRASARSVAKRIVRCARRPRPRILFVPFPSLTLALFDLLPGLWPMMARRYIGMRTGGKGIHGPAEK